MRFYQDLFKVVKCDRFFLFFLLSYTFFIIITICDFSNSSGALANKNMKT